MARKRIIRIPPQTVYTNLDSGDGTYLNLSGYDECMGIVIARVRWETEVQTIAGMVTRPGFQAADVENEASNPSTFGTDTKTGNGWRYPSGTVNIGSATGGKQILRWGIWVKNPAGTTTLQAIRVAMIIEIEECS